MSGARLKSQVVRPTPVKDQPDDRRKSDDYEEGEMSDADSPASSDRHRSESDSPLSGDDVDYAIELQRYTQHREQQERRSKRRRRRSRSDDELSSKRRTSSPRHEVDISAESAKRGGSEGGDSQFKRPAPPVQDTLTTRTGGAYIPPAKLRLMQEQITDKTSVAYQRLAWEALKKSLNGLVNKVNVANLVDISIELLSENVIRGRGLLCRSVLQAQAASPTFTHVYAALMAIVNSKFPQIGELLLHRLVLQFKRGFRRNDKQLCTSACRFVAHLVNHQVAHEVLALELLTLLLETPSDDSVEVAVGFIQQVGQKLTELTSRGTAAIFERLRHILHEAALDKRVQYMIEVAFSVRKDGFKSYPSMVKDLDQLQEDDQFTHTVALDDQLNSHEMLNVFRHDPDYEANEEKYRVIRLELLESDSDSDDDDDSGSESGSDDNQADEEESETAPIVDSTETVLRHLRQTIYLAIQSSLDYEETAHKLLKLQLKPGQEVELCHMIIDCCAQERSYLKFFGLLAERFCNYNRIYQQHFEQIFSDTYDTVHRLETGKLRNLAKLYSHLLHTDAISWAVLQHITLTEEDTTSSSRIFIKICFQELSEFMGLARLVARVNDPTLSSVLEGLFPRDNPKNTRFSINFFTSIGLGGLTEVLRQHLKSQPKPTAVVAPMSANKPPAPTCNQQPNSSESESSSSDSSSSSSSESSSSSSSDSPSSSDSNSSSSDESRRRSVKRKRKKQNASHSKRHRREKGRSSARKSSAHRSRKSKNEEKRMKKRVRRDRSNEKDRIKVIKTERSESDEEVVAFHSGKSQHANHKDRSKRNGGQNSSSRKKDRDRTRDGFSESIGDYEKSDRHRERRRDRHHDHTGECSEPMDRHSDKTNKSSGKSDRNREKSERSRENSGRYRDKSDRSSEITDRHREKLDRQYEKSDRSGEKTDRHREKSDRQYDKSDRSGEKTDRHREKSDRQYEKSDRSGEKTDRHREKSDSQYEKSDRSGEKTDRHREKSDRQYDKSDRHREKTDRHRKTTDHHRGRI